MTISAECLAAIKGAVNRERLIATVLKLCGVHSPTGVAGRVLDTLAAMLADEGFQVERPVGNHPVAPAVAVRLHSGKPGRTLQFNGHVDTVHLPFVPPQVQGDRITGTGTCDMKGGTAAAIEALRVLRETDALPGGSILFTAHDLHEAPWGFGQQLDSLIREGIVGDAVLIPEYLNDRLPTVSRGSATWRISIRRGGAPIHEVMRPADEPSVIDAGAELVARLRQMSTQLAQRSDPEAGHETVFIGQIHSGEIFNQYPQECWLEGTRRWLPGNKPDAVEQELQHLCQQVAQRTRTTIELKFQPIRDAFRLDQEDPFVHVFQDAYATLSGHKLPCGPKAFVDDANSFWALADIPAITHGPTAGGAHTVEEWVSIDDLVRVAELYALTAVGYCAG